MGVGAGELNYYDRTRADEWHAVFDGTDIGRRPTEDRSRHVILRFNFSAFDDTLETLRARFETYCLIEIRATLERNADLFPDEAIRRILAHPSVDGKLRELFKYAGDRGIPLYGPIDEYDNFANTVLAHLAHHGREAYESFTHGGDYGKLRHLLVVNRDAGARFNGNFDLLRNVAGEGGADADVSLSFPLEELVEPENFLSLLYYFGLLSIRGASEGRTRLGIPNQTVRRLMYGYLRDGYRDVGGFSVSHYRFSGLVVDMAYRGAWQPALAFLAEAIAAQTGIRDYLDGEKVVQAFLAAYFSLVGHFLIHSERELAKGYADLHLEPFLARYPDVACGYVLEIEHLKRRGGGALSDRDDPGSWIQESGSRRGERVAIRPAERMLAGIAGLDGVA